MMRIEYIYILRTRDSASADTQYKLTQTDYKNNYNDVYIPIIFSIWVIWLADETD